MCRPHPRSPAIRSDGTPLRPAGPAGAGSGHASGPIDAPGGVLAIEAGQAVDWLGPLPVEALHGIGPKQAAALREFGVHCVGLLAAVPPATVQRLLGGRAGRVAADRARGIDPRPVAPRALPATTTVRHTFAQHTLDGATVRAALLDLVVQLAHQLRQRGQVACGLTLTLRFAGGTAWEKTRRLPEDSAHEDDLRTMAYRLIDAAGLQHGRLTGLVLRGEDLVDADRVALQISLDQAREDRLVAEAVADRIRAKFGPGAIGPAATFRRVS
ncbi:DNA polymerase Y family protein [Streptomyces umbrinus]|uniref:DNA polymerase Y family protein n=1 Tax=Streptomyces umbrinus TaxID=67370 RepID=UPI0033C32920